jgi:hypothetical protein
MCATVAHARGVRLPVTTAWRLHLLPGEEVQQQQSVPNQLQAGSLYSRTEKLKPSGILLSQRLALSFVLSVLQGVLPPAASGAAVFPDGDPVSLWSGNGHTPQVQTWARTWPTGAAQASSTR